MPFYICKKCGEEYCTSAIDVDRVKNTQFGECTNCFTVISSRRYERNIPGAMTVFSTWGPGLGDMIMGLGIRDFYLKENPAEQVIFSETAEQDQTLYLHSPRKMFWSNLSGICNARSQYFVMVNEARAVAKMGFYPKIPYKNRRNKKKFVDNEYIILHIRNVQKCAWKNMPQWEAQRIADFVAGFKCDVVMIGNDDPCDEVRFKNNVIDLRKKLNSIPKIAEIIGGARMFIGRDTGIAHVAAASGCKKGVVYGFKEKNWMPLTSNDFRFIMKHESDKNFDTVLETIGKLWNDENNE